MTFWGFEVSASEGKIVLNTGKMFSPNVGVEKKFDKVSTKVGDE